ncbi:MAG: glycosyltransferase [Gemmatimonadota bacterium]
MNGADPGVSVLLPCRDAAVTLPDCIASLRAQTFSNFEVVAVDDGSTDATPALLAEWAERDGRVRVMDGAGRGLVPALRLAAANALAPLLARMDADDIAHPERLDRQKELLTRRSELAACGTGVALFPREALRSGYRRYEEWLNSLRTPGELLRDLFVECPIAHPTLMIRASALRGLGGYRDMGWPEDYDLILRLHLAGMRAANVEGCLVRWRVTPGRASTSSPSYGPAAFRRCKVHFLRHGVLPTRRPLVVWGAGRVGKAFARELLRQGLPVSAFVDLDRRKIGQMIHGAPVLDPAGFAPRREAFVLVAVGSPGARDEIRLALNALGRRELEDFRVVA